MGNVNETQEREEVYLSASSTATSSTLSELENVEESPDSSLASNSSPLSFFFRLTSSSPLQEQDALHADIPIKFVHVFNLSRRLHRLTLIISSLLDLHTSIAKLPRLVQACLPLERL